MPLPANMTVDLATGEFKFVPTPDQVGSVFSLLFTARRGSESAAATTDVTVVSDPPGSPTRLLGQVRASETDDPLEGVTIAIKGTPLSVSTGPDGRFSISGVPQVANVVEVDGSAAPNGTYAFVAEPIDLLLGHDLYPGQGNEMPRPIYLPLLGAAGGSVSACPDPMDPNSGSISVISSMTSQGLVELTVAPCSAMLDGAVYEGPIFIPEVDPAFTPAALPEELGASLVVAIQPAGISFNPPATIVFPNAEGLPDGSQTEIWSIDPSTGTFGAVGTGLVQGSQITTLVGGVNTASWHLTLPPSPSPCPDGDNNESDGPQCTVGSSAGLASGALRVEHRLPAYWVLGEPVEHTLVYNTKTVRPMISISREIVIPAVSALPNSITTRVEVGGVTLGGESTTTTSNLSESQDETIIQRQLLDRNLLGPGAHPFSLCVTNHFGGASVMGRFEGTVLVSDEVASPFGSGWGLVGLSRLEEEPDGSVVVFSSGGGALRFEPKQGTVPGLDLRFYSLPSHAGGSWAESEFAGLQAQAFTYIDFEGEKTASNLSIAAVDFPSSSLDQAGFFTPGPDGVIDPSSTPNVIAGDDVLFFPSHVNGFGVRISGLIEVPDGGDVTFTVRCDDSFQLRVDETIVAERYTDGGFGVVQGLASDLPAGFLPIEVFFTENVEHANLVLEADGGGLPGGVIPASSFFSTGSLVGEFDSPAGDSSRLIALVGGGYERTLPNGVIDRYDDQGRLVARIDSLGNQWSYAYDASGRVDSLTDPIGGATQFIYQAGLISEVILPDGRSTRYSVDSFGDLVSVTNPDGGKHCFVYDADHLMVLNQGADGIEAAYSYDQFGFVTGSVVEGAHVSTVTSKASYAAGSGPSGASVPAVRSSEAVARHTSAEGNTTEYVLDSLGSVVERRDDLGRVRVVGRNADSLPIDVLEPDSARTTYQYDGDRVTQITMFGDPSDATDDRVWSIVYHGDTSVPMGINLPGFGVTAAGFTLEFDVDASGLVTRVEDAAGGVRRLEYNGAVPGIFGLLTRFGQEVGGSPDAEWSFTYNQQNGCVESIEGPLGRMTEFQYDGSGRVVSVERRHVSGIGASELVQYEYDPMNRITRIVNPDGTEVTMRYDGFGRLVGVCDEKPGCVETTYNYDSFGRIAAITDPSGCTESFGWSPDGYLIRRVTREGNIITSSFDAVGRIIRREFPGEPGTPGNESVVWQYDNNGDGDLTNDFDLPSLISDSDSDLRLQWNAFGELSQAVTSATQFQPSIGLSYSYLQGGLIDRLDVAGDVTTAALQYSWDGAGRLVGIDEAITGFQASLALDPFGVRESLQRQFGGVDLASTYVVDAAKDVVLLDHDLLSGAMTGSVSQFATEYDELGRRNMLSEVRTGHGGVPSDSTFVYDAANRILEVIVDQLTTFDVLYDAAGNRIRDQIVDFDLLYDPGNRLTDDGQFVFEYDNDGNLIVIRDPATNQIVRSLAWSPLGLLQSVDLQDGSSVSYRYDALGRLIHRDWATTQASGSESFVYDGQDLLLTVRSDGTWSFFVNGAWVDEPWIEIESDGGARMFVQDATGNVVDAIDEGGNIAGSATFGPFGLVDRLSGDLSGAPGFAGRFVDDITGWVQLRARWYDPASGRFLSEDPAGQRIDGDSIESGPRFAAFDEESIRLPGITIAEGPEPTRWLTTGQPIFGLPRVNGSVDPLSVSYGADVNLYEFCRGDPSFWRDPTGLKPDPKRLKKCLKACKKVTSWNAFCRTIPHAVVRAGCWALCVVGGVACANWCYWQYGD